MLPTHVKDEVAVMLRMYEMLREEIMQSVEIQSKVILGESILISIIFRFEISGITTRFIENVPTFRFLIATIPPVIIISTAIWLVEQTRMKRAGKHLQELEQRINTELGGRSSMDYITWENDLRNGKYLNDHKIHVWAHYLAPVGFFLLLGFLSLILFYLEFLSSPPMPPHPKIVTLYMSINGILLFLTGLFALKVVGHDEEIEWPKVKHSSSELGKVYSQQKHREANDDFKE